MDKTLDPQEYKVLQKNEKHVYSRLSNYVQSVTGEKNAC